MAVDLSGNYFFDDLTYDAYFSQNIDFVLFQDPTISVTRIKKAQNSYSLYYWINGTMTEVYNNDGWVDSKYQLISFTIEQSVIDSAAEHLKKIIYFNWNINYVLNGTNITNPNPSTFTIADTPILKLEEPTRYGYEFKGWYYDSGFTLPVDEILTMSTTSDYTFYAKWYEPVRTLKQAFALYLNKTLNDYWKALTLDDLNKFSVQCDFSRDDGNFYLNRENGTLVLNDLSILEKYIPVAVPSFNGELVEMPDEFLLDAIIPIEMLVPIDLLDIVVQILEKFQNEVNAKPIVLRARYQENSNTDIQAVFTFNIPDTDAFETLNGINAKIITLQLASMFTREMIYGNDIEYYLSFNGDSADDYIQIKKISPSSSLTTTLYSDQVITENRVQASETTNTWVQTFSLIVRKDNAILSDLIPLVDFESSQLYNSSDNSSATLTLTGLDNMYFKKVYKSKGVYGKKPVIASSIAYSDAYGDFITITLSLSDKMVVGGL